MAAVRGGTEARGQRDGRSFERLEREARHNPRLRKTLLRDWHRLGVCFGKAVDYLRQNFTVLSPGYLYSDYMVAILAHVLLLDRSGAKCQAAGTASQVVLGDNGWQSLFRP